jgi:hypothetical protein
MDTFHGYLEMADITFFVTVHWFLVHQRDLQLVLKRVKDKGNRSQVQGSRFRVKGQGQN